MSPWEKIVETYDKSESAEALSTALDFNLTYGFVFSRPDFFIMGRPVCYSYFRDWRLDGWAVDKSDHDCWFIEAMAGDMAKAWDILPYELPFISWYRFDNVLRKVPLSVVKRLTYHAA